MPVALTKEQFIENAKAKYGDKFDYSEIEFVNRKTKVKIICNVPGHSSFMQSPINHMSSAGCLVCAKESRAVIFRKPLDKCINESNEKFNNKFDYSQIKNFVDIYTKVPIICHIHGIFEQCFIYHLNSKYGCRMCANIQLSVSQRSSLDDFIKRANIIHNNKYNYDKIVYININTNVNIWCLEHGFFTQSPSDHLYKKAGCKKCSDERGADSRRTDINDLIDKIHNLYGEKYDTSLIKYVNNNTKISLKCNIHNKIFDIVPQSLLHGGEGCGDCNRINRSQSHQFTKETFVNMANEIHDEGRYNYDNIEYVDMCTKIEIKCNICSLIFIQNPTHHIHKQRGCPNCKPGSFSNIAIRWLEYIAKNNNIEIQHFLNGGEYTIGKYKVDGFCKENNTVYEFYGDYWHGNPTVFDGEKINKMNYKSFGELYKKTLEREEYIKKQGYKIVTIWENDWKKIEKPFKNEKLNEVKKETVSNETKRISNNKSPKNIKKLDKILKNEKLNKVKKETVSNKTKKISDNKSQSNIKTPAKTPDKIKKSLVVK